MKLKFFGYVIPPLPVTCLVRSVYFDGKDKFYISIVNSNNIIQDFIRISDIKICKIKVSEPILKEVSNSEFFVFIGHESEPIIGEFQEIKQKIRDLLNDSRTNIFLKIEIALFLECKEVLNQVLLELPDINGSFNYKFLKSQLKEIVFSWS